MKTSIFSRILAGALLPVIGVSAVVIGTINSIINVNNESSIRDSSSATVAQISSQISQELYRLEVLQNDISNGLANIRFDQPEAKENANTLLHTYLLSSSDIYSAWFSFDPAVFSDGIPYFRSEYREISNEISEKNKALADWLMETETEPEWYSQPFNTKTTYVDVLGRHKIIGYVDGVPTLTMSSAIVKNGQAIGVVGIDMLYTDIVTFDASAEKNEKLLLVAEDGMILYSQEKDEIGKSILDFGIQDKKSIRAAMQEKEIWIDKNYSPFFEEESIAVFYPFEMKGRSESFFLYRELPVSAATGFFSASMEIIFLTNVIGLILLAFCVFFTTRDIVLHIRRVSEVFHVVADNSGDMTLIGNLSPIIPTKIEELDVLQTALETMIFQLREGHDLKIITIEAELEKEKLLAAAEVKNNFFASMSHEIRTPMNAIIGIAEILLLKQDLMPEQEKHVEDIKIASNALLSIINDIMDISKLESGSMDLAPVNYDFQAMLDNVASMGAHLARNAGLEFELKTIGEIPRCLFGDDLRLRQLILNLIGNAVKYTKKGFVALHVSNAGDFLLFDILDSGIGIKEKDLQSIFQPFERIDTRRNREVSGTGLGLPIAKNLVDLMHGNISVASTYGIGTTFTVTLPLILGDKSQIAREPSGGNVKYVDSLRILIVDDNQVNLNVAKGLLNALYGISCDTANSGIEAIAKVHKVDYDVIFMDHMMPEMDGVDTTMRIRELGGKYETVPIVALTANAISGTREQLIAAGMNDFLSKPIAKRELQEVLNRWVPEGKRIFDADGADTAPEAISETIFHAPELKVASGLEVSDVRFQKLREIENLDLGNGLENIGFDVDMYFQSLRLLAEKIPPTAQILMDALEEKNLKSFRVHVHGLKGALAGIGAMKLSSHAADLEMAAANNEEEYCHIEMPAFLADIMLFQENLTEAIPPEEASPVMASENGEQYGTLKQACEALYETLETYDYELITKVLQRVLAMPQGDAEKEILAHIKTCIKSFDYAAATALLEEHFLKT